MPNFSLHLNSDVPLGADAPAIARGSDGTALRWFRNMLDSVINGQRPSQSVIVGWNDAVAVGSDATLAPAAAALVGSTLSGSVGATIAGTAVTVTAAGGDTATQTALATAIRANTSVNPYVTADNRIMQLTLASVAAGATVDICGIRFTAVATAAAIRAFGQFNIDGTDAQDSAALALAINRHPAMSGRVRAVAAAAGGVVYLGRVDPLQPISPVERLLNPGAGITVNTGTPTASAICMLIAIMPGVISNEIRAVASGTGMTIETNGTSGLLGGGTGNGRATSRMVVIP